MSRTPPVLAATTGAVLACPVKLAPSMVGLALNTARPVPVSSVRAPARFALLGVAKNVATPTPSPVNPVVGRPVQFARLPDDGVPRIGVISVGDVANTAFPVQVSSVIAFLSSADVVISVLLLKFIVLFVSVCGAVVVTTSIPAI